MILKPKQQTKNIEEAIMEILEKYEARNRPIYNELKLLTTCVERNLNPNFIRKIIESKTN